MALRNRRPPPPLGRDFHRFWVGSMSSNAADGVLLTVLPLMAASFTNDPVLVAGLTVVRFLPWLLFGLLIGALADRVDRGRLMIAANVVRAAVLVGLAVLVASGHATILTLYAVMFVAMCCEAFYDVGGRALMPELVARDALDRANSRVTGGRAVTQDFGGAPLGGVLFVVAAALPLAVNAAAYVLGALILVAIPLTARRPPRSAVADTGSALASMWNGMGFIWGDRQLRDIVVHGSAVALGFAVQSSVVVLVLRVHFGVPEVMYGVFVSSAALGALCGAILVGRTVAALGRFWTEVLAYTAMGVGFLAFVLSPNAYVAGVFWCLIAAAMAVSNTVITGIAQLIIPPELRGRVLSAIQVLAMGSSALGALLGGLLGRWDLRAPSLVGGVLVIAVTMLFLPALRAVTARADEAQGRDRSAAREDLPT